MNRVRPLPAEHGLAQRALALLLACLLALTTIVSAITIAEFHDHDCTGDDCPICLVLEAAQATLSASATPVASAGIAAIALCLLVLGVALSNRARIVDTPVSLKVKITI